MECPICFADVPLSFGFVECQHYFCKGCILNLKNNCALCRRVSEGSILPNTKELINGICQGNMICLDHLETESRQRIELIMSKVLYKFEPRKNWTTDYIIHVRRLCERTSKPLRKAFDVAFNNNISNNDNNMNNIRFGYMGNVSTILYSKHPVFDFILKDLILNDPSLKIKGVHLLKTKIELVDGRIVNAIQYAVGAWHDENNSDNDKDSDISELFSRFNPNLVLAAALSLRENALSFKHYEKMTFKELCTEYGCPHYYINSDVEVMHQIVKSYRRRKISLLIEENKPGSGGKFVNNVSEVIRALLRSNRFGEYIEAEDGWLIYRF